MEETSSGEETGAKSRPLWTVKKESHGTHQTWPLEGGGPASEKDQKAVISGNVIRDGRFQILGGGVATTRGRGEGRGRGMGWSDCTFHIDHF